MLDLNDVDIEFLMQNRARKYVGKYYVKTAKLLLVLFIPMLIAVICIAWALPELNPGERIPTGTILTLIIPLIFLILGWITLQGKIEKDTEKLTKRYISEAKR
jgi:amino acid transporter